MLPLTPSDMFCSRPTWKNLPAEFLEVLATRFDSTQKADKFADLCENAGILNDSFLPILAGNAEHPNFALGLMASTLYKLSGVFERREDWSEARRILEFAILIQPRHPPAWARLAMVADILGDKKAALYWANKFLSFTPEHGTKDYWELGLESAMTTEGIQEAAEALGALTMVEAWSTMRDRMQAIKTTATQEPEVFLDAEVGSRKTEELYDPASWKAAVLRAIEWEFWPLFLSQPLIPALLLLYDWRWVWALVWVSTLLWFPWRLELANVYFAVWGQRIVNFLRWPVTIGTALWFLANGMVLKGLLAGATLAMVAVSFLVMQTVTGFLIGHDSPQPIARKFLGQLGIFPRKS